MDDFVRTITNDATTPVLGNNMVMPWPAGRR
jgi:hypothetical protein